VIIENQGRETVQLLIHVIRRQIAKPLVDGIFALKFRPAFMDLPLDPHQIITAWGYSW
jgi:hypothetical protein